MKNPTSGGGFSLLNGVGRPLGRLVRPLSNMKATSLATSSVDRPNPSSKLIKLQYQCKFKEESSSFYKLTGRGLDWQVVSTRRPVSPNSQVGRSAEG
jgi:hypothetical protein